jgi:hypothetical protein
MQYVEKAIMDSVQAANLNREDLSNFLSVTDGPKRPVTQVAPKVPATNKIHQWNEQGLNVAGRVNVAGGGPTYAEGALPPVNYKAAVRKTNTTCRVGRTAQVSDDEIAAFNGGGSIMLADGETERLVQGALDLSSALVMIEVLNQIEWMHISGDSTNATMEGGETDGLLKFITAGGTVVATGGSSTTPISFNERFIKDGTRTVQLAYPSLYADTLLVATELIPDINLTVQSGSNRPIVQVATAQNQDFVAGASVGWYNTGYSVLKIKEEPYLSPIYNSSVSQPSMLAYNSTQVRHAQLIPLSAQEVARTDTSLKRAVTTNFAQEHRVPRHTWTSPNVTSSVP